MQTSDLQKSKLNKLTRQIKGSYESAKAFANNAEQLMQCAIVEAIIVGQKLGDARRLLPNVEFDRWLTEHWEGSSESAARYMALAKVSSMVDTRDLRSLQQAWIDLLANRTDCRTEARVGANSTPPKAYSPARVWTGR